VSSVATNTFTSNGDLPVAAGLCEGFAPAAPDNLALSFHRHITDFVQNEAFPLCCLLEKFRILRPVLIRSPRGLHANNSASIRSGAMARHNSR